MLYIAGVGIAHPERELSVAELSAYFPTSPSLAKQYRKHYTSLSQEYLQSTKNENPMAAEASASLSPSILGAKAALAALEQAGLALDQVALVLAGTATPMETCPSEAQRIAKILGLKVPAFDITAGGLDLFEQINAIAAWSEESTPDYVLCISTQLLSQRVEYTADREGAVFGASCFGDLACALLITKKQEKGIAEIKSISAPTLSRRVNGLVLDVYYPAELQEDELRSWANREDAQALAELKEVAEAKFFLASGLFPECSQKNAEQYAPKAKLIDSSKDYGFSMGASPFAALARYSDLSISPGDTLAVEFAGLGQSAGALLLQWCAKGEA